MVSINMTPLAVNTVAGAFFLGFPALFSIVNPIGSALIFHGVTESRSRLDRHVLSGRIALYATFVLLGSLWLGSYILNLFGISLGALRIAGGLVVAISAWNVLMAPKEHEDQKAAHAMGAENSFDNVAFFPLTMPFTTGPGSIAVAIALSSQRPNGTLSTLFFFSGMSVAAVCVTVLVWFSYRYSDQIIALLGDSGQRVLTRLVAFLLLCVGVQIVSTGVESLAMLILHNPFVS